MPFHPERYPTDWKTISLRIRAREGNRCKWCGAPNGEQVYRNKIHSEIWITKLDWKHKPPFLKGQYKKPVRIVLTVAHLDHDTTNNTDDNLAALCQRCHLKHDGAIHAKHAAETRRGQFEEQQPPLPGMDV